MTKSTQNILGEKNIFIQRMSSKHTGHFWSEFRTLGVGRLVGRRPSSLALALAGGRPGEAGLGMGALLLPGAGAAEPESPFRPDTPQLPPDQPGLSPDSRSNCFLSLSLLQLDRRTRSGRGRCQGLERGRGHEGDRGQRDRRH